jgi:hypothetical protein
MDLELIYKSQRDLKDLNCLCYISFYPNGKNVKSSKLQVPILKDQELENLTTSKYLMSHPKKQQHQG